MNFLFFSPDIIKVNPFFAISLALADRIQNFFAKEQLNELLINVGFKIISVILVCVIMSVIRRLGKNMLKKAFAVNVERIQKVTGGTERRKETFESLSLNIWRYTVNIVLILWLVSIFIPLQNLLIASSAFFVVIGFAAKSMLDDITMGFFIIFEDLFSVGDFVEIDGNTGTVTEIGLRSVKIRVLTGEIVIIPNGNIGKVINHSVSNGQAVLDISIAYEADIDQAILVLEGVAQDAFDKYETILQLPQILGVQELADSAIVIRMIAEVSPLQQWHIQRELRRLIKKSFDQHNIEIPYSKMVIYQKNEGGAQ
ncbi:MULTISPECIES: mechanosensitive ion channel family protein [Turicibacter]|uniref:Mechanosensitive ion channel protein MscS n=1 Tax=Turicibacter faecis TaxID=2963365 RepID=A0ABM8IRI9_9FIRM|nr:MULTISPECIES: mechanosensitive ion channel domain-containing protein [unclassified Turicibacter]MCU7204749.1 mechanosensitive ion channel family protein [Turicibacter sp. TA25]MCU7209557.1 mechanosensitive ion channel family protein [Turicibacter sp. 1E2]BEH92064.1 mechanosensitive ion channel protein MscS [Turicibacter sp. TC023]